MITIVESGEKTLVSHEVSTIKMNEKERRLNSALSLGSSNKDDFTILIGKQIVQAKLNSVEMFNE